MMQHSQISLLLVCLLFLRFAHSDSNAVSSPPSPISESPPPSPTGLSPYNRTLFAYVKNLAAELIRDEGFNAGKGYREVWIRDFNTFIEVALDVPKYSLEDIRGNLTVFFEFQMENGSIADGFWWNVTNSTSNDPSSEHFPSKRWARFSDDQQPGVVVRTVFDSGNNASIVMFKNTVEQDQESSLVQAVRKYLIRTGDIDFLNLVVKNLTVAQRMDKALMFLKNLKFSNTYGLVKGATRVDWGDVQAEDGGVLVNNLTHPSICIYDNSMYLIAIENYIDMHPVAAMKWMPIHSNISRNVRRFLWDRDKWKFIPHIYLEKGSPFPVGFIENEIFYHGGTGIAMEAGLLSKAEVEFSIGKMVQNVKDMGAATIGLTVYPCYANGLFKHMNCCFYQNAGDWTWFGGRIISQLIDYELYVDAYEQLLPMLQRVDRIADFNEWFDIENVPRGSPRFKGSAGVLHKAIEKLEATGFLETLSSDHRLSLT